MIAVLCHVVSPTGQRSVGWRPSSIAHNPVVQVALQGEQTSMIGAQLPMFTPVKFNQRTWG